MQELGRKNVFSQQQRRFPWKKNIDDLALFDHVGVVISPKIEVLFGQQHSVRGREGINKTAFVTHRDNRSFPMSKHLSNSFDARGIQIVRRFVEHEKISVR